MSDLNESVGKKGFADKIGDAIMPVAEKLQSFSFITALSQTMQVLLPVVIIGSFACLFAFLDIGGWQSFMQAHPSIMVACMKIQSVTLSLFGFYVLLVLPYMYATSLNMKQALGTMPLSIAAFLILTPTELYASIPAQWLGHPGLISAIFVSFVVVRVTKLCIDKKIRIKMPAGVPPFVENAFAVLVPSAIIIVVFSIVNTLFAATSMGTFHQFIYTIVQVPFQRVGLSNLGNMFSELAMTLLMFCGIHANTILGIVDPLRVAAAMENLAAWQAGLPLPNIVVSGFSNLANIGAGGSLLIPTLSILLFSKSKKFKSIARIAIVPGIFGVGEPILFGLPIMLNPMFLIPFVLVTIFNQLFAYLIIAGGLIGRFTGVVTSWTIPPILNVILTSSTPFRAVIAQLIIIAIDIAIWYPFVRTADKLALKEEAALAQK
jgi:PTS system cellobiose-specific IIC component